jgi:hypothetical protein
MWRAVIAGLLLVLLSGAANAQRMVMESVLDAGHGFSRSWVDVNNDGKDDYCVFAGGNAERVECYLSTPSGFSTTRTTYNVGNYPKTRFWWVDVNGDGRVDLCRLMGSIQEQLPLVGGSSTAAPDINVQCRLGPSLITSTVTFSLPKYNSWTYCVLWDSCDGVPLPGAEDSKQTYFADVNLDGRADFCYVHRDGGAYSFRCFLMTGSGFVAPSGNWIKPLSSPGSTDWPSGMFDVNGDGFPDFCRVVGAGLGCDLGHPDGFNAGITFNLASLGSATNYKDGAAFVDANGDGKTDFCRITGPSAGNYRLSCRLSTGKAWETADRSSGIVNEGRRYDRWWVDINGDGLTDFCRAVGPDPSDFANPSQNKFSNLWCRLARGGDATTGLFALDDIKLENSTTHGYVNFGRTDGGRGFCDAHGTGVSTFCRATFRSESTGQACYPTYDNEVCYETFANTHGIAVGVYAGMPADPNTSDSIVVSSDQADSTQASPPVLWSYSDGLGAETRLTYMPLTSDRVYDRTFANEKWPRIQIIQPRSSVVFETRAWRKGTQTTLTGNARYAYRDLRVDNQTGSRGFRERWQLNEGANTLEHVIYYQGLGPTVDPSSIDLGMLEVGQPKETKIYAIDPTQIVASTSPGLNDRQKALEGAMTKARSTSPISMSTNAVSPPTASYPFMLLKRNVNTLGNTTPVNPLFLPVTSSSMTAWDWNVRTAVALPSVVTQTSMDDVGNVLQLVETTTHAGQEWKKTTTNTYADNRTSHFLGRLTSSRVVSTAPAADVQIAANARNYGSSPNANTISSANGAAAPLTVPAFGTTPVGQNSTVNATLTNTMFSPLVIVPPTTTSVSGQDFSFVSTTCGASLAASGTCTITVRFAPTAATERTGAVAIETASGMRVAALSGNGLTAFSTATLTSAPPNLGSVWYGAAAPSTTVSLRNDGNTAMTLTGLTGLSSRFTLSNNTCSSIAPTATCSMTITMPTSTTGSSANAVTTAGATNNASFDINGTVNSAVSRWSVTTLAFGNVTIGQSSTLNVTLHNDGFGTPFNWNAALANLPSGFTANTSACSSVSPGSNCSVALTFAPTTAGAFSGSNIRPGSVSYTANTLSVSGTGVAPTTTITAPASVSFGTSIPKGGFVSRSVAITNSGSVAATNLGYAITLGGGSPGYTVGAGTCPSAGGTLAAGATCNLVVHFEASCTGGSRNGTLSITSANLPTAKTVSLTATVRTTGICGV